MATCDVCGQQEDMPYTCHYCGGSYCVEHRLPENHGCAGLENWGDPAGVFDSGFDASVRHEGGRRSSALDLDAGGLFGYFRGNLSYTFLALMWVTFFLQLILGRVFPRSLYEALFYLSSAHPEYVWTWVTAVFAHGSFGHIVVNSIVLYFFGPIVERRVGTKMYFVLFIGAGMAAGLAQVGAGLLLEAGRVTRVLGASGAIMAVMGVLTVLNPQLRVYLYFILPVPLWLLTVAFAGYSVFIALGGGIGAGGVAHLAHLTGLAVGLGYGEKLKREGATAPTQLQLGGRRGPRRRF